MGPLFSSTINFRFDATKLASHFFKIEGRRLPNSLNILLAGAPTAELAAATATETTPVAATATTAATTALEGGGTQTSGNEVGSRTG